MSVANNQNIACSAIEVSPIAEDRGDVQYKILVTALSAKTNKKIRSCASSVTFQELIAVVAKDFDYDPSQVELVLDSTDAVEEIVIAPTWDKTLGDLNLNPSRPNKFLLRAKDGQTLPENIKPAPEATSDTSWKTYNNNDGTTDNNNARADTSTDANNDDNVKRRNMGVSQSSGPDNSSYSYWNTKSSTGFVGLANQGATCYLNSLLQSLYMTPEFRNAIYRWRRDKESASSSIPYELQKLFVLLQTSKEKAIETTSITKSFGWERAEAFQQHDVQELLRVLMQALEVAMKGTEQAELFQELYEGEMKDRVQCKSCGYESSRPDKFTDIPLVLKPFGANKCVDSVEEALAKFVEVELLTDDNKYECSGCKQKVDAIKGLKITKLPRLLTLQLKRFDYDFQYNRRIKLSDKVTFPHELDLGWLLDESAEGPPSPDDPPSDHVYELYSIMIHSGSALGGHYFAYIRSFADGKWYCFNDSSVTEIEESAIERTFGGAAPGRYNYSSGATAYMLMYRSRCAESEEFITTEHLPDHVVKIIDDIEHEEERKRQAEEERKQQLRCMIYYHKDGSDENVMERELHINKDKTLREAVAEARERLGLDVPVERLQLRKYSPHYHMPGATFTGQEDTKLQDLPLYSAIIHLLLDEAGPDGQLEEFTDSDMHVNVIFYDSNEKCFVPGKRVKLRKLDSIADLKEKIAEQRGIAADSIRLCMEKSYPRKLQLLDNNNQRVSSCSDAYRMMTVFADDGAEEESQEGYRFLQCDFAQAIDRRSNEIEVEIILPGEGKDDKDDKGKVVRVDQRWSLNKFKQEIVQPLVDLPPDQIQLHRWMHSGLAECNQHRSALENVLYSVKKVWVKEGKCLGEGEVSVSVHLFRLSADPMVEFLCKVPGKDKLPVPEFKERIVQAVELEKKQNPKWKFSDLELPMDRLRLRECTAASAPRGILMDTAQLPFLYASANLCIQVLDTPEQKVNTRDVLVFARQWHPADYTLGPLLEFVVPADGGLEALSDIIQEATGIPIIDLGFGKVSYKYNHPAFPWDLERLTIPDHEWDSQLMSLSSLGCSMDGNCLLFRDNTEELAELTTEQRSKIREEDAALAREAAKRSNTRTTYYTPRKEKALTINVATSPDQKSPMPFPPGDDDADVKVTAL